MRHWYDTEKAKRQLFLCQEAAQSVSVALGMATGKAWHAAFATGVVLLSHQSGISELSVALPYASLMTGMAVATSEALQKFCGPSADVLFKCKE
mmetsp:Transcript_90755/g.265647  ORF Transcript_90755/g.265647 Transcript_90755/m.265647 type:complete len:94 (+) Transcript_90755:1-282(+)